MRSLDSNSMENSRKRVVVSKTLTYESTLLKLESPDYFFEIKVHITD